MILYRSGTCREYQILVAPRTLQPPLLQRERQAYRGSEAKAAQTFEQTDLDRWGETGRS